MNITVLYNRGSQFELNEEQKITDEDTFKNVLHVNNVLINAGYNTNVVGITPKDINLINKIKSDLVFNLCEWAGKDFPLAVRVIEKLAENKIPYTGADAKSYLWGSDKMLMKKLFIRNSIPTPRYLTMKNKITKELLKKILNLTFPLIMKPAYEHCGIGIRDSSVLRNSENIVNRINDYKKIYQQPIIVEEFIEGREFQVTVLQNGITKVLPPAEIIFAESEGKEKIYSFGSKWEDSPEESVYEETIIPNHREKIVQKIKLLAKKVFLKLKCKGYARLDLRVNEENINVLEVNVNPVLDPDPDYTMTASSHAIGWDYKDLVLEIAKAGLIS